MKKFWAYFSLVLIKRLFPTRVSTSKPRERQ